MKRLSSIEEYRIRISALEAQGKWKEVQKNYERVTEKVGGSLTSPKTIMLEFARFLYRQKNYQKSLDVCLLFIDRINWLVSMSDFGNATFHLTGYYLGSK